MFLFFSFTSVSALEGYPLDRQTYEGIYYVQNGLPEHYGSDNQFMFSFNGVSAYCVNVRRAIKSYSYDGVFLDNSIFNSDDLDYLNKVMYYGYDYPGHQNIYYYMATQSLIWNRLTGYDISFYTERYGYGNLIDISYELSEISNLVFNHGRLPEFANKVLYYDDVSSIVLSDDFLSNYEVVSSNYDNVYIDGNRLVVDGLSNYYGLININFKSKSYRDDVSMYYISGESQEMISGGRLEPVNFSLSLQVNGSDLIINKKDLESGLFLKNSNTSFNVLNMLDNSYVYVDGKKDLFVDSSGVLKISNLPHGKYKIIEVSTDSLYSLSEPVVVDFDLSNIVDNCLSVDFFNSVSLFDLDITKYGEVYDYSDNSYFFERLSDIEFSLVSSDDLYLNDGRLVYSKDEVVASSKTDLEGHIRFTDLIMGNYYLVENNLSSSYLYDEVDVFVDDNKSIDVYNYLKKKDYLIKKIDGDTNETLSGVSFEVFDDDGVVGIFTTDINGEISLNLPISNYSIQEVSTIDGYILSTDVLDLSDEVIVENYKYIVLPNTYKNDFNFIYLIFGLILLKRLF